jgi:hypothetical protein
MSIIHLDPLGQPGSARRPERLSRWTVTKCPDDCRVPDREEVASIFENRYVPRPL